MKRFARARSHRPTDWRYACQVRDETNCELCADPGGDLLWEDVWCRVIRVRGTEAQAFPGFCRVVWRQHVAEMSALATRDAHHVMDVVMATERALRQTVKPDKINLASLGNVVPHLHWHIIPRWKDDSHFPAPIWASRKRDGVSRSIPADADLLRALTAELSTLTESI